MKKLATATAILAMLAMPALADDNSKAPDFVKNAAIAGMFEIQSSQMALQKSDDGEVKTFAQQMIDDHTKVAAQLQQTVAASGTGVTIPTTLDEKHQKMLDTLSKDSAGKSFNVDYTDMQHKGHEHAVKVFRDYAEHGDNPQLKTFASQTLPTLKMHEDTAANLDAKF